MAIKVTVIEDVIKVKVGDSLSQSGATNFLSLTDTPSDYTGQAGKIATVNGAETGLDFAVFSGFIWNDITGDLTVSINNGYLTNGIGERQLTLPVTASFGTEIKIASGTAVWKVLQNAGQKVIMGDETSNIGIAGYIKGDGDATLVCTIANLTWKVIASQGNLTLNI